MNETMPSPQTPRNNLNTLSKCNPTDQIRHHKCWWQCCLDTLPSDCFKTLFKSARTNLQQIDNGSLLSATLPKSLKTAANKPLFKTRTLLCLTTIGAVSNLPLSNHCFQSAQQFYKLKWSFWRTSIRLPTSPQYWNDPHKRVKWYMAEYWFR